MKTRICFATGMAALFLVLNVGLTQEVKVLQDQLYYTCGFGYLKEHEKEIIQNTRILNKNLPEQLEQINEIQHDIGDILSFYTYNYQSNTYEQISAVCRAKSNSTYIFVEDAEWNAERVTQNAVDNFYKAFEESTPLSSVDSSKGIREIMETYYGSTPNKSGNGYVYILIQDIKDDYDPPSQTTYIAGYFNPSDQGDGSYSNKKDIIYVDSNPGNPSSQTALSIVAHEFQHLIHYGLDRNEQTWLNEGASEYASFLCGYGLRFYLYDLFLSNPEKSLISWNGELSDYARVSLWTYYLGEKFGHSFITDVAQASDNGTDGVQSALTKNGINLSFDDVFSNFLVANYADAPEIDQTGYYGYEKIDLPVLPKISNTHKSYPVDSQQKNLPSYSTAYFRFTAQDSTAILNFSGQTFGDIRAKIYQNGFNKSVYEFPLNEGNQGQFSLKDIGQDVSEILLIPASLSNSNNYSYFVTTEIEDITAPQITSGPKESLPTGNSVTIFWETDEAATSIVEYGLTDSYGQVFEDTSLTVVHQVLLTNLQSNTVYHYRIGSTDNKGNGPSFSLDFTFATTEISTQTVATVQQTHSFGYQGRNLVRDTIGDLHLIYHELVGEQRFVYHQKTADNGENWSQPLQIDDSNYYGGMPAIAIDSLDRIHVVWHAKELSDSKYGINYSRSDDSGETWSSTILISRILQDDDLLYAAIAIDYQNNPHVVYNSALYDDNFAGDVYYTYSVDGGINWNNDKIISTSTEHRCFVSTINLTSTGKAFVLYLDGDFDARTRDIHVVSSDDYQQWNPSLNVSNSGALYDSFHSFVIDSKDQVHLVYADNFTPGDIRVMYTYLSGNIWQTPIPAAKSITGGNVSYPNLSIDGQDQLYLVYRDDMEGPNLGKLVKNDHPNEERPSLSKQLDPNDKGEIFLTINSNNSWIPGTNLSNDSRNSEYPELPVKSQNGVIDLIWMNELSATSNTLKYINYNTDFKPDLPPPQIVSIFPEADATDVPYFKQVFELNVSFDQRIEVDSLISENVVITNSANEQIVGEISYEESTRQMKFRPTSNLPVDDLITVKLTSDITNNYGFGLDGNKNGISEGSPTDDFIWTFRTQPLDTEPPIFTIGILQNPILTKYMDLYVVASEYLSETPKLKIGSQSISLILNNQDAQIYKGNYKLNESGNLQLTVTGKDLAGNNGNSNKSFSAQLMLADHGGIINSTDDRIQLSISPQSMKDNTYFTIVKKVGSSNVDNYQIGPTSLELDKAGQITFEFSSEIENQNYTIEQQNLDGSWQNVPSEVIGSTVVAKVQTLGNFRIAEMEKIIPTDFNLRQNYPNPFSLSKQFTSIAYEIPKKSTVEIFIYNLLGERIKSIIKKEQNAGTYKINWDGTNNQNQRVATGVYFYQLRSNQVKITNKLLVLN